MKFPSFFPTGTDLQDDKEALCAGPYGQGVSKSKTFKGQFVDKLELLVEGDGGYSAWDIQTKNSSVRRLRTQCLCETCWALGTELSNVVINIFMPYLDTN